MSRIARVTVLVAALLSLFATEVTSAGAVTWDNSGNTHFVMTSGTGTLSSTAVNMNWQGVDVTGRTTTPISGATAPIMHLTARFTFALLAGQSVGVDCGYTFTATTGTATGATGFLDTTCGVYLANLKICHIEGAVPATYTNPTPPSVAGRLTTGTGGNLRVTDADFNCGLGHDDAAHLSVLTFTVSAGTGGSGTLGPIITRTA